MSGLKDITRKSHTITNRPRFSWFDNTSESFTDSEARDYNLDLNAILEHLKTPMHFVLQVEHHERYATPTLVRGAWPLRKEEWTRLAAWQWPKPVAPPPPPPAPAPQKPQRQQQPPKAKPKPKSPTLQALEDAAMKPPKKKRS